jgi:hypothetical protein
MFLYSCLMRSVVSQTREIEYRNGHKNKITVFWDVAPCSLVEVYRRFRGACCLHHQGDIPENSPFHTRLRENLKSHPDIMRLRFKRNVNLRQTRLWLHVDTDSYLSESKLKSSVRITCFGFRTCNFSIQAKDVKLGLYYMKTSVTSGRILPN